MCGICGKFVFDREARAPASLVKAMADTICHRGPDDEGSYVSGPIGLGFRRKDCDLVLPHSVLRLSGTRMVPSTAIIGALW